MVPNEVKGHEAIVSIGFGMSIAPQIVVDNSPLANKVKRFDPQPDLGPYDTGICVMEKRLKSPIVNSFWSQLKEL